METIKRIPAILFRMRPFANVHWSLLLIFVGLWELWLWIAWWGELLSYGPILVTVTVCSALWSGYQRALTFTSWRRVAAFSGGAIYDFITLALWLAILAVPIPFVGGPPIHDGRSPRTTVSQLIWSGDLAPVREEIARRILQRHSLSGTGAGRIKSTGHIEDGLVTDNGTIVVMAKEPHAVVILQPRLDDGKVEWKCSVSPAMLVPDGCLPTDGQSLRFP